MIETQTPIETIEKEEVSSIIIKEPSRFYLIIKRMFDFCASFCASLVLLIPMAIVSLIIVLKDNGSPFYKQMRLGKDGKMIGVYKFRSMKVGADNLEKMLTPEQIEIYKREYKLSDDPRLIGYKKEGDGSKCFGALIRRLSIDELPQILINICIKGDMSIVGPRPILQSEIEENYSPEQQKAFLSVKPGLTGYWQAYARNGATYETGERQKMEMYYILNRSAWLDLKIIFKTIVSVVKKSGAK